MIVDEIKIHPEPVYTVTITPPANIGARMMAAQRDKEEQDNLGKFLLAKDKAKMLYQVGDRVTLKTNTRSEIKITRFLENVSEMLMYQGEPCIVEGHNSSYQSSGFVKYSLPELDETTIIREEANVAAI